MNRNQSGIVPWPTLPEFVNPNSTAGRPHQCKRCQPLTQKPPISGRKTALVFSGATRHSTAKAGGTSRPRPRSSTVDPSSHRPPLYACSSVRSSGGPFFTPKLRRSGTEFDLEPVHPPGFRSDDDQPDRCQRALAVGDVQLRFHDVAFCGALLPCQAVNTLRQSTRRKKDGNKASIQRKKLC